MYNKPRTMKNDAEMEEFYQFCFDEFNLTENGIKDFIKTWEKEIFRLMK